MANNSKNEWGQKELGVLWKRKAKTSGETFLTGKINLKSQGFDKDISVIVFQNKGKKEGTQQPDLRIYFSDPPTGTSAPAKKAAAPAKASPAPAAEDEQLI